MITAALVAAPSNLLLPATPDIVWSAVTAALIAWVFLRYALPAFTRVLDERTARIEGGLAQAEVAQEQAAQALATYQDRLAEARVEAARIRDEARVEGARIVADLRAKATEDAGRIVQTAQRQIDAERQQAAVQLRAEIGDLATALASKIVGEALADEVRRSRVVDRFLDELQATATGQQG